MNATSAASEANDKQASDTESRSAPTGSIDSHDVKAAHEPACFETLVVWDTTALYSPYESVRLHNTSLFVAQAVFMRAADSDFDRPDDGRRQDAAIQSRNPAPGATTKRSVMHPRIIDGPEIARH
jgi:hypothetical protein